MPRVHSAFRSDQVRPAQRRYAQAAATHAWHALCDRRDMYAVAHAWGVDLIASQGSLVPVLPAYAVSAYVCIITIQDGLRYPHHILNTIHFTHHSSNVHLPYHRLPRPRHPRHRTLRLPRPQRPCHRLPRPRHPRHRPLGLPHP